MDEEKEGEEKKMICEDCGGKIGEARLKVNPKAKLCISCQEEQEDRGDFKRHRMSFNIKFKADEVEEMTGEIVRG